MAAARAAELGCRTLLLEKSSKVGAKILMSGGTRCNITHATNAQGIADAFAAFDKKQAGFLRSSLAALPPEKVIELFEDEGIATKVEDTGKVFPVSNRAVDVRDALLRRAENSGVSLTIGAAVTEIEKQQQGFVVKTSEQRFIASRLLITSGGQSYPGCGTTGDGYWWARQFGHKVVNPLPALTPITTDEQWVRNLQGITLPDAMLSIVRSDPQQEANGYSSKHFLASRRSSVLFTHFGFSGPAALDISRTITLSTEPTSLNLVCDFLPTSGFEDFLSQLTDDCRGAGRGSVSAVVQGLLPKRLAGAVMDRTGVPAVNRAAELSRREIRNLARMIKGAIVPISGTLGFQKAEVTAGGVSLEEVDSRTLQSSIVDGLYFAGEVLDIDGPIGGFNFQAAFSTGWLAGQSVADNTHSI
ncbi:MAG: NAD(P)/FAD-dependent oxidoreductase [Fuerstiella sp.]|nr:NAD(P)/FAD-dependent oxidoreductase [Fuerstiella sp.]MCP4858496.1 NAD(P)/FAD-dependent oxidoreductase [Fuerstiella sp.]